MRVNAVVLLWCAVAAVGWTTVVKASAVSETLLLETEIYQLEDQDRLTQLLDETVEMLEFDGIKISQLELQPPTPDSSSSDDDDANDDVSVGDDRCEKEDLKQCFVKAGRAMRPCIRKLVQLPAFKKCIKKPNIQKSLKQLKDAANKTHVAFVRCLKSKQMESVRPTPTSDPSIDSDSSSSSADCSSSSSSSSSSSCSDSSSNPPAIEVFGNIVAGSRKGGRGLAKCFQEAGKKFARCVKLALKCPKIKKCFNDPNVKKLRQKLAQADRQFGKQLVDCMKSTPE